MSDDAVKYRISKMEKLGVIRGYKPVLDLEMLGLEETVLVNVKLGGHSTEEKLRFVAFLKEESNIVSVMETAGECDFVLLFRLQDKKEFCALQDKIRDNFSELITEWTATVAVKNWKD